MTSRLAGLRRAGFAVQSAVMTGALAISCVLVGWLALWLGGPMGLAAATVAAGLCFVGAEVALIIGHLLRPTPFSHFGFMAGMLPRMGVPLVFGLFVQVTVPSLGRAGLLLYLVVFYLVVLAVGTMLSLPASKDVPGSVNVGLLPKPLIRHGS